MEKEKVRKEEVQKKGDVIFAHLVPVWKNNFLLDGTHNWILELKYMFGKD